MAAYLQFIAGDFGKAKFIYQRRDKLHNYHRPFFGKSLRLSDIASCEEASSENIKKAGGTIGGAVVGGVLLGGIGAVVGGMAGGNHVETTVIITTRNGEQGLARANSPMMDAIRGQLFEAKRAQEAGRPIPKKTWPWWQKACVVFVILVVLGALFGNKDPQQEAKQTSTQSQEKVLNKSD